MSREPVERAQFPTVRAHSKTGSLPGPEAVLPGSQPSMYYNDLFIP
jgi:hypothetical protein